MFITMRTPCLLNCKKVLALKRKQDMGQYFLDLGQKDFSSTTCSVCGMVYARGLQSDELDHRNFHANCTRGILFKGWRDERVVSLVNGTGDRVLLVLPEDKRHLSKVKEVAATVEAEMGLNPGWLFQDSCKVYLFISSTKKIVGCLMAEPIKVAFRVLPGKKRQWNKASKHLTAEVDSVPPRTGASEVMSAPPTTAGASVSERSSCKNKPLKITDYYKRPLTFVSEEKRSTIDSFDCPTSSVSNIKNSSGKNYIVFGKVELRREVLPKKKLRQEIMDELDGAVFYDNTTTVPAVCGVRVIWVSSSERRKGVASHLLDAVRSTFCFGVILKPSQLAFSQPTADGRNFAVRYCQTEEFLVYVSD